MSFKHLKILIFDIYSKLCRDILRGLRDLAKSEEDIAKLGTFRETFSIKSIVISKGRAKLANMRAAGVVVLLLVAVVLLLLLIEELLMVEELIVVEVLLLVVVKMTIVILNQ